MQRRQNRREDQEPLLPVSGQPSSPHTAVKKDAQRLPKRTTKTSQKLTLFPEGISENVIADLQLEDDDQQLPHVTAKTQKEQWLSKLERKFLPRVTAYCTAK